MENTEGIIGSIKNWLRLKKSPSKLTPEPPRLIPGWDYETYREYLLALTKSRDYLLPIEEYPSRIGLDKEWHELFNSMRVNSYEGWALMGYETGQRKIILPTVAEKGLSHSVPHEVMVTALNRARIKKGITDLVGDTHSHPREFGHPSWYIPTVETSSGTGSFSLADLYGFLNDLTQQRPSDPKRSVMFVVEGNENIAVFVTRRSLELVRNNFSDPYEKFAKYWYERYGWSFKGREPKSNGGGELVIPAKANAPATWQINKGVAYHYQLSLYRGFKNGPLLREHPARNGI